ncbi:MAG: HIG1 domain-containing protein [Candidatus Paracaedibacteraceae bacterium]|nr:HIG1 domain-containing protein [Candidatus Paracaedibacteraceae bacterium]
MTRILEILFFSSLTWTLICLVFGLTVYFKGGHLNARYGNAAMRWRVTFQAITLALFLLLLLAKN